MITPEWYCFFCLEIITELRRLEQLAIGGFDDSKKQEDLLREIWGSYHQRCAAQIDHLGVPELICTALYGKTLRALGIDSTLFEEGLDWKAVKEEFDAQS